MSEHTSFCNLYAFRLTEADRLRRTCPWLKEDMSDPCFGSFFYDLQRSILCKTVDNDIDAFRYRGQGTVDPVGTYLIQVCSYRVDAYAGASEKFIDCSPLVLRFDSLRCQL